MLVFFFFFDMCVSSQSDVLWPAVSGHGLPHPPDEGVGSAGKYAILSQLNLRKMHVSNR